MNPELEQQARRWLAALAKESADAAVRAVETRGYSVDPSGNGEPLHHSGLWARAGGPWRPVGDDSIEPSALLSAAAVARTREEPLRRAWQRGPTLPDCLEAALAAHIANETSRWLETETLVMDTAGHHTRDRAAFHWRERQIGGTNVVSWADGLDVGGDLDGGASALDLGGDVKRAPVRGLGSARELVLGPTASLSLAALIADDLHTAPAELGRAKKGGRSLSIVRDPSIASPGGFDAEGTPRRYGAILYHGVYTGVLSDRRRAKQRGLSRSLGSCTEVAGELRPAPDVLLIPPDPDGPSESELAGELEEGVWLRGPIQRTGEGLLCHLGQQLEGGQPAGASPPLPYLLECSPIELGLGVLAAASEAREAAVPRSGRAPLMGRAAALRIRVPGR